MEEFLGVYSIEDCYEKQYIKIIAEDLDEANEKLEEYLNENNIEWIETEIITILVTID